MTSTHHPPDANSSMASCTNITETDAPSQGQLWPTCPRLISSATLKTTGFVFASLVVLWLLGNATQRKVASFLLAAPIVFVMFLLILAASNIAFSLLYTRSQASASHQLYTTQRHRKTMPGQAARTLFHSLRPAYFTRPTAWSHIEKRRQQEQAAKYRTPVADTMPHLSEAVDSVIELIMRDYVSGWMRAITPEVVLQQRIEELLRIVLIRLKVRVMDLDLTQLLVIRLVPKVTSHVNDFRKAEMALRGNSLERALTESDELDIMVASKFRQGKLHRALSTSISTTASEEAYFRNVIQTILPTLLPKSEVQSEILRHLVRELLVGAVLRPVMDLLSDPDYWNQNVDLYTGKAIREQNMVKKLREALKQHTDNMDANSRVIENPSDPYGTGADLYSFEDFLKMIKRCDSLLDVKRIRNTIMTQIRKKKALIVNREKDDIVNGNKVEDIIVYINRLDIARRRAEKRIEALGGPAYPKRRTRDSASESKGTPTEVTLETILTNPSGLSYFMEFLDRRDNMSELQFWLLIDTLNIKSDTDSNEESSISDGRRSNNGMSNSTSASTLASGQKSTTDSQPPTSLDSASIRNSRKNSVATTVDDVTDTLREDIHMIYDTYFADTAPRPVDVDHSLVKAFQEFAFGDHSSSKSVSSISSNIEIKRREESKATQVRQQLLVAQRQVFDQMSSRDFPEFSKTDLYFKFLASYQNSANETKDDDAASSQTGHHRQNSNSKPALFSGIASSSSEKRLNAPENPKRSSTGSFLDIFGLGRDKDRDLKEREREHQKYNRRSGPPGMTPSFAHSRSVSSITGRPRDIPAQSKPTPTSTLRPIPSSLGRSRSMSSISNPERPVSASSNRASVVHDLNKSLDFAEPEIIDKEAVAHDALADSLLRELQDQDDDELDELLDGSKAGLKIPKMPKSKRKDNVIDAVEAALSSIMETQSQDDLGLKDKEKAVDPTDPTFSTARDNPDAAFMEWGKSQEKTGKRFKEKGLNDGKAIRAKSRESSDLGRTTLSDIFSSEKQTTPSRPLSQASLLSGSEYEGEKPLMTLDTKPAGGKNIAGSIAEDTAQENVHLAAPGDLLLATRITKLEQDIETVRKQESIVETLIRKAEKQGRQEELRILKKSKSALRREILSMEYQKTQYEVQAAENMIMPGRSTVSITSSTVGHDGSKEFALYVIEVHQMAQDGSFASGWVIARRYSEFFALHQQLKEKFAVVRQYELPGKRGFLKLQKSFVESRRIGLEKYLQLLVQHSDICQSQELRAFLSQENIALPQFSAPPSLPLLYSLFEQSSNDISASASNDMSPPQNQHFFENLFHSATSPISSPVAREPFGQHFGSNSVHEDKRDSTSSMEQGEGFMKHIYQTVSEGLDDMFSGGPPTVLGNITKQLGNQMIQFSIEADEEDSKVDGQSNQGSVGTEGRLLVDSLASPSPSRGLPMAQSAVDLQRPTLNSLSVRSRRLSSPDPHTQHQKLQLKQQEQLQPSKLQFQQEQVQIQQQHQQQQHQHQLRPVVEPEGVTTFTEPLCDLFIELFELKEKNNWLRRQAVVIILQQVLGGTIERKLRDTIKAYIEESMLTFYVNKLRDALWPPAVSPAASMEGLSGGYEVVGDPRLPMSSRPEALAEASSSSSPGKNKPTRTAEQKALTKEQANRKLSAFLPELLGNMVGHQNARRGARRVFAAFQNRRLNQQLVYTTLDEIILAMWPELGLDASGEAETASGLGISMPSLSDSGR
ncbi:Intermediate filament protein [Podila verticillata]|nr:Intermediate filament protein [Podila verticillata]